MDKQRLVALLRGINVGRAKRVAMADLRKVLSDMGYSDVRTLLNSGNVVFDCNTADAADSALRIEEALVLKLGVPAKVTVIEAAQLAEIVKENSLQAVADDHSRLLVAMTQVAAPLARLKPLARLAWDREQVHVGEHAAYLWCPNGILESKVAEALLGGLPEGTTRNWATLNKIHGLMNGE